jgi:hypothetical protein
MRTSGTPWRDQPRRRHKVSARTAKLLAPLFAYSYYRDAYILRGIGDWIGPVFTIDR